MYCYVWIFNYAEDDIVLNCDYRDEILKHKQFLDTRQLVMHILCIFQIFINITEKDFCLYIMIYYGYYMD